MAKPIINIATIKAITIKKVNVERKSSTFTKIGKKRQAVIFKDDNILKARLTQSPVEDEVIKEFHVLPLTPDSFTPKGKIYVFAKKLDKNKRHICIIRNSVIANTYYGSPNQYDTLYEGLLIDGHIVRKDGKYYFNYENLIAFTEQGAHINALV